MLRIQGKQTRPCLESLEERIVPSNSDDYLVNESSVTFQQEKVYLQVSGGILQYNLDGGGAFTSVLHEDNSPFEVDSDSEIQNTSGELYLMAMDQGGGCYVGGSISIQGNLITGGGNLSFQATSGSIRVASAVDPQHGLRIDTSSVTGTAGDLSFRAKANYGATTDGIYFGDYSSVRARGATGFADGKLVVEAKDVHSGIGLKAWDFLLQMGNFTHSATISFGVGTQVLVGDFSATAETGDKNLLEPSSQDPSNAYAWIDGMVIEQLSDLVNDLASLPASAIYQQASSTITVGAGASITGTGDVHLQSLAYPSAAASAIYWYKAIQNRFGFAIGTAIADTDAVTHIASGATLTAGGDLTVAARAESVASMTATVGQNTGKFKSPVNPNNIGVAIGVTVLDSTVHATVDAGAHLAAPAGRVSVLAEGSGTNGLGVSTSSYYDGMLGLAAGVAYTRSDVKATVNGTIEAGEPPDLGSATFNPFLTVDFESSTIVLGADLGYRTGQEVRYSSGLGGAIPGLVNGESYYVIVDPLTPTRLRLAATRSDALAGNALSFGVGYPTLNGIPFANIDSTSHTILFDFDPGFTEGQTVTYAPVAGQFLGHGQPGLPLPAGNYTIHIVRGSADASGLYAVQLLDTNQQVVPLNDDPFFRTVDNKVIRAYSFSEADNAVYFQTADLQAAGVTFTNGMPLTYTQAFGLVVPGLNDAQTYFAVVDPTNPTMIRLAATADQAAASNPARLSAQPTLTVGSGSPLPIAALDTTDNLTAGGLPNALVFTTDPGLTDGARVTYHEAAGRPIAGLIDGLSYYAYHLTNPLADPSESTWLVGLKSKPADANYLTYVLSATFTDGTNTYLVKKADGVTNTLTLISSDGTTPTLTPGTALVYHDSYGQHVGGLVDGRTYYVSVAPTQPAAGELLVALCESAAAAVSESPTFLPLSDTVILGSPASPYLSGEFHSLTPATGKAITIAAEWTSRDRGAVGASLGGAPSLLATINEGVSFFKPDEWKEIFKNLTTYTNPDFEGMAHELEEKAEGQMNQTNTVGVSVLVLNVSNSVVAEVGSTAVLKTAGSIDVRAELTELTQTKVIAGASKPEYQSGWTVADSNLIATYDNTCHALIDGGAVVDAGEELAVEAKTRYPFVFQVQNPNPSAFEFFVQKGWANCKDFLSGSLGVSDWLVNSWSTSSLSAKNSSVGAAGSLQVQSFTNDTQARIDAGAQINQNPAYQNGEQAVSVEAELDTTQVNFVGLVNLAFTPETLVESIRKHSLSALSFINVPQDGKSGIGGSLGVLYTNNTTHAILGGPETSPTPTRVNFGKSLTVHAKQSLTTIGMAQAGGDASGTVVAGTLNTSWLFSNTTAQIFSNTLVTSNDEDSGDVTVKAEDSVTEIQLAGVVLVGANNEYGVSSNLHYMDRDVMALIGDVNATSTTPIYAVCVGGKVTVDADSDGAIVALTLSGAKSSFGPAGEPGNQIGDLANAEGEQIEDAGLGGLIQPHQNPAEIGADNAQGVYGVAVSGDISVFYINGTLQAAIVGPGHITTGGEVEVRASDDTGYGLGAGGAAFTTNTEVESTGVAGSVCLFVQVCEIDAFVKQASLSVPALSVNADRGNTVVSLAAGGSGEPAETGTAVAGSVIASVLNNTTRAYLDSVAGTLSGDSEVTAHDGTTLIGVAGAFVSGGKNGYGLGIAVQVIDNSTTAEMTSVNLTQTAGDLDLTASNDDVVVSVAAGLSFARTGVAASGMFTVNYLNNSAVARMTGGSYTNSGGGDLSLSVKDQPIVVAIVAAYSGSRESSGIGGAVSYNQITNTNQATLSGARATLSTGTLYVTCQTSTPDTPISENPSVDPALGVKHAVWSVAVGGDKAKKNAVATAVTVNYLASQTTAQVVQQAMIQTGGHVVVTATDAGDIFSAGGAVAYATSESGKAIGPAATSNVMANTTRALLDGSTVTTQGAVQLSATESSLIGTLAVAGAVANLTIAGAVTVNDIQNTTTATISNSIGSGGTPAVDGRAGILVTARDQSLLVSIAGDISYATEESFGASVTTNLLHDTTTASISNSSIRSLAGGVRVTAGWDLPSNTTPDYLPDSLPQNLRTQVIAAGLSGGVSGEENAVAGTVLTSITGNTISATLTNSTITAQGDVAVLAVDNYSLSNGLLEFEKSPSGGGATVATIVMSDTLVADVAGCNLTVGGNVGIQAAQQAQILSVIVALDGGNEFALGGAVGVIDQHNTSNATLENSTVTAGGTVDLQALDEVSVLSTAGMLDLSTEGSVIGASVLSTTNIDRTAALIKFSTVTSTAGDVRVEAVAQPAIMAAAIGATAAEGISVIGSILVTVLSTTTTATIQGNSSTPILADGNVVVSAVENLGIGLGAGAVSEGKKSGTGIANSTLVTTNTTTALIDTGASVLGRGNHSAYAALTGQKNAKGDWITENVYGVSVTAVSYLNAVNSALGGELAGSVGVGGSVTVETLSHTTQALINTGARINVPIPGHPGTASTLQGINLHAAATTEMWVGAGGAVFDKGTGVGAGVDVAVLTKTTTAAVQDAPQSASATILQAAGDIRVRADSTEDVHSIAAAIAVGKTTGVAGSVSSYTVLPTTTARLGNYSQTTADGNVQVAANDTNKLLMVEGSVAGSTRSGAIGASVGVAVVTRHTTASIGQYARVDAHAKGSGLTVPTGMFTQTSAPASFGVSAVNLADNSIDLGYAHGWQNGQPVIYNASAEAMSGLTAGDAYYAVVDPNNPTKLRLAATAEDAEAGNAIALGSAGGEGQSLRELGSPLPRLNANAPVAPGLQAPLLTTANTVLMRGVSVTSTSLDHIEQWVIAAGGAAKYDVEVATGVQIVHGTTRAYIDQNAQVNSDRANAGSLQSVQVAAGSVYTHVAVEGAAAFSKQASVGPAVDVSVVHLTTEAFIDQGASVQASNDIIVVATGKETITSVTVGLSGAATVAVDGSVSVLNLNTTTRAFIGSQDPTVLNPLQTRAHAGNNLLVRAQDDTNFLAVDGAVALGVDLEGSVSVGAAVSVSSITKNTIAYLGNNTDIQALGAGTDSMQVVSGDPAGQNGFPLKNGQGVAVQALSSESISTWGFAGSLGSVAFAASVAVTTVNSTTQAFTGTTTINKDLTGASAAQGVYLGAANTCSLTNNIPVALSAGLVALGGAVNIGYVNNLTQAWVGSGSTVQATGDVDVYALSDQSLHGFTLNVGVGGVGIGASVVVATVGAALDAYSQSALTAQDGSTAAGKVASTTQVKDSVNALKGWQALPNSGNTVSTSGTTQTSGNSAQIQAGLATSQQTIALETANNPVAATLNASTAPTSGTTAFVGSGVLLTAGGNLQVEAQETITVALTTGNGLVAGVAAIGAAVSVIQVHGNAEAYIDHQATLSVQKNLSVNASLTENLSALSAAGQAGLVSLGAQVAVITENSTQTAFIGQGTLILQAGDIVVSAGANRTLHSNASQYASVGAVAAGAAIASSVAHGSTQSYLSSGVQIGPVGSDTSPTVQSLSVTATHFTAAEAIDLAVTAGIGAGQGNSATVFVDPQVTASIGDSGHIQLQGNASVSAQSSVPTALARSLGVVTGGLAVGISETHATVSPTVNANLGSSVNLQANNLTVQAIHNGDAESSAMACQGSLLGFIGSFATTTSNATTTASVGDNSHLTVAGLTQILSANTTSQTSSATGDGGGVFLAAGDNQSHANSTTSTIATLGNGVQVSGAALSIAATGSDYNLANARAGLGGVVSGFAAEGYTDATSTTSATLGSGVGIAMGTFQLAANHTQQSNTQVDTVNASLVGYSGSNTTNNLTPTVQVIIGPTASIQAQTIDLRSANVVSKPKLDNQAVNISSGSGGAVDVPAGKNTTTASPQTLIRVGDGSSLNAVAGLDGTTGRITLESRNDLESWDQVQMVAGGAVAVPMMSTSFSADGTNATVEIGNARLTSSGGIALAARADANVGSVTEVHGYGFAGHISGHSSSTVNVTNLVHLASGAILSARGEVSLAAGRDLAGAIGNFDVEAATDVYDGIWLGGTNPSATAKLNQSSLVNIDSGAQVLAGSDVALVADPGNAKVIGNANDSATQNNQSTGLPYAVTISVGDASVNTNAGVTVNGLVQTGVGSSVSLTIDAGLQVPTQGPQGQQVISRANVDNDQGQVYIDSSSAFTYAGQPLSFLIYATNTTNTITPLLFQVQNGVYTLAAVGNPEQPFQRGVNTFPVQLIQGSLAPGVTYAFGFSDRNVSAGAGSAITTNSMSTGTIPWNNEASSHWLNTNALGFPTGATLNLGQTFSQSTTGIRLNSGRTYSAFLTTIPGIQHRDPNGVLTDFPAFHYTATPSASVTPTLVVEDLIQDITTELQTLANLKAQYAGNAQAQAGFQGRISQLQMELMQLFGLSAPPDSIPNVSIPVGIIDVPNITAGVGTISVAGTFLAGTGKLISPGDAEINVVNNSPYFLRLHDLTIPNAFGGLIQFNNLPVNSNADVNAANARNGSNQTAAFTEIDTNLNRTPVISVSNTYNPSLPQPDGANIGLNMQQFVTPAIEVDGTVTVRGGVFEASNASGNIDVNGSISAATVDINAGGNFTVNSSGMYHVGGDPMQQWAAQAQADDSRAFANPGYSNQVNGTVPEGTAIGSILADQNILINAQVLNLNGVIQSGRPDRSVTILDQAVGDPATARANVNSEPGQVYIDAGCPFQASDLPQSLAFYANSSGQYLTPLLFSVDGGNYALRAVGQSFKVGQTGLNVIPFYLLSGAVVPGETCVFGFTDRQLTLSDGGTLLTSSSGTGSIPYDVAANGNWLYTTTLSTTSQSVLALNQEFSTTATGGNLLYGGRTYSAFMQIRGTGLRALGDAAISRSRLDTDTAQVHIQIGGSFFGANLPSTFTFYASAANQAITPLFFEFVGGNYQLAAVGETFFSYQTGVNVAALRLIQGALDPARTYYFGFADRQVTPGSGDAITTVASHSGVIPYDANGYGQWASTSATFFNASTKLSLGQTFGGANPLNYGQSYSAFLSASDEEARAIGSPISPRTYTDGYVGQVYLDPASSFDGANQPQSVAIYAKATGHYLTPLLFEVRGNAFALSAVGQSILISQTGPQSAPFKLIQGSVQAGTEYVFGFTDRYLTASGSSVSTTAAYSGATGYDNSGSWLYSTNLGTWSTSLGLGQTFSKDNVSGAVLLGSGRTYSASLVLAGATSPVSSVVTSGVALFEQAYQQQLSQGRKPSPYYTLTGDNARGNGITSQYNADTNQVEVFATELRGGFVQLTGQIISTGNGVVKAVSGHNNITIDNQTGYDLVLNTLDTGGPEGVEGRVVIIDTSRAVLDTSGNLQPMTTTYRHNSATGQVTSEVNSGVGVGAAINRSTLDTSVGQVHINTQGSFLGSAPPPAFTFYAENANQFITPLLFSFNGTQYFLQAVGQSIQASTPGTNMAPLQILSGSLNPSTVYYFGFTDRLVQTGSTGLITTQAFAGSVPHDLANNGTWLTSSNLATTANSLELNQAFSTLGAVLPSYGTALFGNGNYSVSLLTTDSITTYGSQLTTRGQLDTFTGQVYLCTDTFPGQNRPEAFGFFAAAPGHAVTPLVFQVSADGNTYSLVAVGQSAQAGQVGVHTSLFKLIQGAIDPSGTYVFGFTDRQIVAGAGQGIVTQASYSGSIPFDTQSSGAKWVYTALSNLGDLHLSDTFSATGRSNHVLYTGREYSGRFFTANVPGPVAGRSTTYQPEAKQRLYWQTGQKGVATTTKSWSWETSSYLWGAFDKDHEKNYPPDWTNYQATTSITLDRGDYIDWAGVANPSGYLFSSQQVNDPNGTYTWDSGAVVVSRHKHWYGTTQTYYQEQTITQQGFSDFYTHSVRADYPVTIEFIGYDAGSIHVTSNAGILIQGELMNATGVTQLAAATSIEMPGSLPITTRDLRLQAGEGIGELAPIQTALNGGTLSASTLAGDLQLTETQGAIQVLNAVSGTGNVTLHAPGDILAAGSVLPSNAPALINRANLDTHAGQMYLDAGNVFQGNNLPQVMVFRSSGTNQSLTPLLFQVTPAGYQLAAIYRSVSVNQGLNLAPLQILQGQVDPTANYVCGYSDILAETGFYDGSLDVDKMFAGAIPFDFAASGSWQYTTSLYPASDLQLNQVFSMTSSLSSSCHLQGGRTYSAAFLGGQIAGRLLALQSQGGSLGSMQHALPVLTGDGRYSEGLLARAAGNIYLAQAQGDMLLQSIDSSNGTVVLTASVGSILDNNSAIQHDQRDLQELQALWQRLQLQGDAAQQSLQEQVTAYQNGMTQQYFTYWLEYRQLAPTFEASTYQFQYSAQERQVLLNQGMTADQIRAEETQQTDQAKQLDIRFGNTTYDPNYQYSATPEELAQMGQNVAWTQNDLMYPVPAEAIAGLSRSLGDTPEPFNISGYNLTLNAAGTVGIYAGSMVLDLTKPLTDEERQALSQADVDSIHLAPDGKSLTLSLVQDLDVLVHNLISINAGSDVHVYSPQSVNLDLVKAGGTVEFFAQGDITNKGSSLTINLQAPEIILTAHSGGIGTGSTNPLRMNSGSGGVSLDATQGIRAIQPSGDLLVKSVTAGGAVSLEAHGSILMHPQASPVAITSAGLTLTADIGSLGTASRPLTVHEAVGYKPYLTAANGIYLTYPLGSVQLGNVLTQQGDVVITVPDRAGPGQNISLGQGHSIRALVGNVQLQAGDQIRLDQGSLVSAPEGSIALLPDYNHVGPDAGSSSLLAGRLFADSVSYVSGTGSDHVQVVANAQNADIQFHTPYRNNTITLVTPAGNNRVVVTPTQIDIDGVQTLFAASHDRLIVQAGAGQDIFVVRGTRAGTRITLEGQTGNDAFFLTARPEARTSTLDAIRGLVTVIGGAGFDRLFLNDRSRAGRRDYSITPTTIRPWQAPYITSTAPSPTTFAGVNFNGTTELVRMDAGPGTNFIRVIPSRMTSFWFNGRGGNNYLLPNSNQAQITGLYFTAPHQGVYTFADGFRPLVFENMMVPVASITKEDRAWYQTDLAQRLAARLFPFVPWPEAGLTSTLDTVFTRMGQGLLFV